MKKFLNFKKGFAPIVVLVIALVVIGGGYAAVKNRKADKLNESKNQITENAGIPMYNYTDSADWKTYRSKTFSIKYPQSWVEKESVTDKSSNVQIFDDLDGKFYFSITEQLNLNPATNRPYLNVDDYISYPDDYRTRPKGVSVSVGGMEGRQVSPTAGSENVNSVVLFSRDSKYVYTIELGVGEIQKGNNPVLTETADMNLSKKIFGKIIESFKFFEAMIPDSIWKSYFPKITSSIQVGDTLYISGVNEPERDKPVSIILKIKPNNEPEVVYRHNLKDTLFQSFQGPVYLLSGRSRYLILGLAPCYHCGSSATVRLVLNAETGKEVVLGIVTDVNINEGNNVVEYREAERVYDQNCASEEPTACWETNAVGKVMSKPLP